QRRVGMAHFITLDASPADLERGSNLSGGAHELGGVAPLVVVPAQNLDHVAAGDLGHTSVKDAAMGIRDDVGGNNWVLGVRKGIAQFASGSLFHCRIDFFDRNIARGSKCQVGCGAGDGRHAHCVAIQLAIKFWQHQCYSLSCTSGGWHHIHRCRTRTTQVLVRRILQALVTGVGVDGGHQALFDAELLVQNLGHRCQAVGGAGCRRDDVVVGRIVGVRVDAVDKGRVHILAWSGDNNLLCTGFDVCLRCFTIGKTTGGFNDDIYVIVSPLEVFRIRLFVYSDTLSVYDNRSVVKLDFTIEATQHGV